LNYRLTPHCSYIVVLPQLTQNKGLYIKRLKLIKPGKWADDLTLVSQLGLTMAGSILLCFAIGYYLDKWFGTMGLFITIFILLGIAGGGYTVYREIMKTLGQEKKEKKEHDRREQRS
jgi:ATP synthase protein I